MSTPIHGPSRLYNPLLFEQAADFAYQMRARRLGYEVRDAELERQKTSRIKMGERLYRLTDRVRRELETVGIQMTIELIEQQRRLMRSRGEV